MGSFIGFIIISIIFPPAAPIMAIIFVIGLLGGGRKTSE